jgi:hypothetical protein
MKADPAYFPTRVGTKWVYTRGGSDETHTVTKVEVKEGETLVTVEWDRGVPEKPSEVVSVRPDGLYLVSETGVPYDPPWLILRCPVELGKGWKWKTQRELGGQDVTISDERTTASERIKVPAGEFDAVRVEAEYSFQPGGGRVRTVYWYAPHVGLVQINRPPHLVLKSFSPGKE